jgi:hypothetical protein
VRKTVLSALIVGVLLAASSIEAAPAPEAGAGLNTVLTVSVSGFDAMKGDLQTIAQATGVPQVTMPLMMIGPQGPAGLDTTKPAGAVVQTDGQAFPFYVFLPVTDLSKFVATLKPMLGDGVSGPDAEGVYEINAQGQQFVMAQKGDWAFLANSRETLARVPADPVPLLDGLNKTYAVAVRATIKNVPAPLREQAIMPLKLGLQMGQQQLPNETPEDFAARKKLITQSMEDFDRFVKETDTLLIGLAVDAQTKAVRLDVDMTAIPGSTTAADYALAAQAKSDLTGFYRPEAALTLLLAGKMPESDAAQLQAMVETYGNRALADLEEQDLSDSERKLAKQMLGDLISVIRKTVETRRADAGLAVLATAESLDVIAGSFVADVETLEKLVKQMVHLAIAEDPGLESAIKLDAEVYQGVRLSTVSVPPNQLGPDAAEIPKMLVGEALTAAVGFGDQHVYLAFGPKSVDQLKQAIDKSKAAPGQAVPSGRLSLSATAIGTIAEGLGGAEAPAPAPQIIEALKQAGQDDHLLLSYEAIPNGTRGRLEIQAGVLKVIGTAVNAVIKQFGAGMGGPGAKSPF